eukprot:1141469-Pelagomonas_calceolata.AAC.4
MIEFSGSNSNGNGLAAWEQHARAKLQLSGWQEAYARVLSASIAAIWGGLDEASFIRQAVICCRKP